jgi:hypothetical protein
LLARLSQFFRRHGESRRGRWVTLDSQERTIAKARRLPRGRDACGNREEAFVKKHVRSAGRWIAGVAIGVVAVAGAAAPASAQGVDVGVGYQASHIPENWNPLGFNVDVAFPMTDPWSVVVEAGMTRDSESEEGIEGSLTDWNFGGGVRYKLATAAPLGVSVDLIAGAVRRDISVDGLDELFEIDPETKFMIQPAVSITYDLADNYAFLANLGYRRVFGGDESLLFGDEDSGGENQFRIVLGVRVKLGR